MNDNCNNIDSSLDPSWRRAMEIVREGKRNRPTCCFGPTGPTGPQGPATITVGTTSTGLPGTQASVTNVGTNENVVLNFSIPEGEVGPTGPTAQLFKSSNNIIIDSS